MAVREDHGHRTPVINVGTWDFPSNPMVKTPLAMQGAWFQSLVGEPGSTCHVSQPSKFKVIIINGNLSGRERRGVWVENLK